MQFKFALKVSLLGMLTFFSMSNTQAQAITDLSLVNSPFDEQHPVLSPEGDLYFSIAFHPENRRGTADPGDVWISASNALQEFQKPVHIPSLSTSGYDVVVGFLDGQTVLVYHDGKEKPQGIHQYSGSSNSWKHEKQLVLGSFRNQSAHFSGRLSPSGDILIFSLASFGSYGNEDIYVSFVKQDNTWSSPQNLGADINTYRQEMTPFLSGDNQVLYFSSNSHGGRGGMDVFFAVRQDDSWENWSVPTPLSTGNTAGIELGFFHHPDGPGRAFFTSTQNSEGYGDIWMVNDGKFAVEIKKSRETTQKIADSVTAKTVEKTITETVPGVIKKEGNAQTSMVKAAPTMEPVGSRQLEEKHVHPDTKKEGPHLQFKVLDMNSLKEIDYAIVLLDSSGTKSPKMSSRAYQKSFPIDATGIREITFTSAGYLPLTLEMDQLEDGSEPILLAPATQGASINLEQVLFKRGTADFLDSKSTDFISSLADFLLENPSIKILLEGHTDNLGNVLLNKELSLDRAAAIRKILVDHGVGFERIRIMGWGGAKPISSNQNEAGRARNRRVEMVIL